MAIRADELTLLDLAKDYGATVSLHEVAYVSTLVEPRKVIPLHRGVVEIAAAISTWNAFLQASVPADDFGVSSALLPKTDRPRLGVIVMVVGTAAWFAPRLIAAATSMELAKRPPLPALVTVLHLLAA